MKVRRPQHALRTTILALSMPFAIPALAAIETTAPVSFCYFSGQNILCRSSPQLAGDSACESVGDGTATNVSKTGPSSWRVNCLNAPDQVFGVVQRGNCPPPAIGPNYQYVFETELCQRDVAQCTPPTVLDPATNRCVLPKCVPPEVLNPVNNTCEPPKSFTISLSGGTEVEPSKGSDLKTLPIIATVKDQYGQAPNPAVIVHVSLNVDFKSGGHDHGDSARPRGGIAGKPSCDSSGDGECWSHTTDGNGQVVFNFNPTETSGKHIISATCDGCTNNPQTVEVKVRVKESAAAGWDSLPASPSDYQLVGGETGKKHHDNHYLTATARDNLKRLVKAYNLAYPAGPVLRLNDASLEWGGRFDILGNWAGDHKNHRRGVVIDIRANQDPTAIPQARFANFEILARHSGAYADLHCAFSGPYVCPACLLDTGSNRHYHVRLLGQGIDK